ncbi:MAG TPA: 50S ribosomal protein L11 methyltransferase [Burkholderiaceae bacterium]|nr:50S ribosomal protein L11 methyltransferase [Burkholderiaceae bacterium]
MLIEITLTADDNSAEALADVLLEHGALAVSIEDANAGNSDEQALYGEPGCEPTRPTWARSRLHILVEPSKADAMIEAALATTQTAADIEARVPVSETDWVRESQSQFAPTRISERLWIVPSWHQAPENATVVRLDPGVAFGTGTHPTTRLCLTWLDVSLRAGVSVLDYGCGSGILAIAAAKLGAGTVVGVDIDPQALAAARANSRANGVDASYTDLHEFSQSNISFDVVLANILSNPLKLLAPALVARLAPRGFLVLSGILERQVDEVIAAYRHADATLRLESWRADDGWVCMLGTR